MTAPAVIMREIHRLRKFTRDLQEQIDRIPKQIKIHQAKVARQQDLLKEAQDAIKKLKVGVHEKEVSLKALHTQLTKYQKQLAEAASKPKEYEALQHEIAHAKAEASRIEDEALAEMGESEERTAKLPESEKAVRLAKEEAAAYEKGASERQAGLAAQLAEATAKLHEVEATVPSDVRGLYNRVVAAMGADAFGMVEGRSCTACYTEMTAQAATDIQQQQFVICKSCGRILYLPG
jgi:predicted  nucleic acid-binding Zn-ribbon protein